MQTISNKLKQIMILSILLLVVISFSLCTSPDDDDNNDDDDKKNGDNGGNGNNTTKDDPITNITTRQDPPMGSLGSPVRIFVTFDSVYPIPENSVLFQRCVDTYCIDFDEMTFDNINTEYFYDLNIEPEYQGKELKFKIKIIDSLNNELITDYIDIIFL